MINLRDFCASSDSLRPALAKPFPFGDFTYATDGRILVRVPRAEFSSESGAWTPPNPTKIGPYDHDALSDWMSVPELPEPELLTCERCNGSGNTLKCKECRGNGCCECDCGHEHNCGYCDGTGNKSAGPDKCEYCEDGQTQKTQIVDLGTACANAIYLRKIATLPDPLIAVPKIGDAPIAFKFTGGVGYLMPMRKGTER